jgi:hypothetical protein
LLEIYVSTSLFNVNLIFLVENDTFCDGTPYTHGEGLNIYLVSEYCGDIPKLKPPCCLEVVKKVCGEQYTTRLPRAVPQSLFLLLICFTLSCIMIFDVVFHF